MSLTREDVKHLADLARLAQTAEELSKSEQELEAILGYVNRLQRVPTDGVLPHAMPAKASGWRQDEENTYDDLAHELILSNFPSRKNDLLSVPAVFEKPKG